MKETNSPSHHPANARLKELLGLVRHSFVTHRLRLLLGFIALLAVDFLQLIIPRIIKHGVDGLANANITQIGLMKLGGLILSIALVIAVLRFVWRYLIIGFSRLLEQAVRNRLFRHILKMDAQFFEKYTTGDLMAHSSNDLNAVQMACGMGLVAAVDAFVMSTAAIGFMVHIHGQLTLMALLPMPFLAIFTRILSGRLHRRFATVQEQFSSMTEFARSTLISIRLIKAYTTEKFQTERFGKLGRGYVQSNLRVAVIQGLIFPIATMVGNLGMLLVLWFGGKLVIAGTISIGDFVAFITYLYMLVWPMMAIGWVTNLVQRGLTSLNRIHTLVTSKPALPELENHNLAPIAHPTYSLRELTFFYQNETQPALNDIRLELGPGIHGVTGRTGCGKSTLCRLLARLYPVMDGQLFFDNTDVNTLPVDYIRAHLGYVGQEPILFSDTIAANIALGKPDATQAEIEAAARHAAIHNDIIELSDGYGTLIGERGVKLSGGQRQRLALARALVCDRPLLIIDDGLSAVDVATEHEVFNGLQQRLAGKTVIIVSNRIKLLSMTDRTIILEEGRIAYDGRHDELLKQSSLYRSMYDKQMRQTPIAEPVP
ncbi:ABC transporter ATP-binding protein [Desulfopila aestuarii]|uniref:ATP-binding cassette, subfamily B n=1 Tax=Desulfopila aestuarii DSM 18488 TaxID=1121416 RepID=A0A1M7YGG4_9BACT|nr:ABC transporter ATP-binding protein [Desulfopila aestuarii]SHO51710.1 ATP-binding cassette, subfamily B [Desulfopila aestuarii DSM 18488]